MIQVSTAPASTPAALVTATARAWLGAEAGDDTRIQALIEEATVSGETIAGRKWIYRGYTERIVLARADQWLYLQARPVSSVTSVAYGTDTALVEGTDANQFAVWPTALYMEDGWETGEPGYSVVYSAGFWLPASMGASPPATAQSIDVEGLDCRRAIWEIVHATWERDRRDATLRSMSAPGSSVAFQAASLAIPPVARSLLGGLRGSV